MKVCMIETCQDDSAGSIGAWYVAEHAQRAGYRVDVLRRPRSGYDVELVSVHHCSDFPNLARLPKLSRYRIVGGHPTTNNPRPIIPFADAVCIGEGETWIGKALALLDATDDINALSDLPGTIISKRWHRGDTVPRSNVERPLPDNPPYLNHEGRKRAWYVEIARGCPYRCSFCELGHSTPFRFYPPEHIKGCLDRADVGITRKINFYAPDEVSHPNYHELYEYLMTRGYSASFSSMRVESVLRRGIPNLKMNHLIRIGVDGLTEATRRRVNKPITDEMLEKYFRIFVERGHVQFKMFFIFGYPWETIGDFSGFEGLMDRLMRIPLHKNISLRLKWTPFIPQPCTPLGQERAKYDFDMVDKINVWHALHARPRDSRLPGWYIEADGGGPMSYQTHRRQCELTAGDETVLLGHGVIPLHRIE